MHILAVVHNIIILFTNNSCHLNSLSCLLPVPSFCIVMSGHQSLPPISRAHASGASLTSPKKHPPEVPPAKLGGANNKYKFPGDFGNDIIKKLVMVVVFSGF